MAVIYLCDTPEIQTRRAASHSLFGLAPDGVYHAPSVALGAVGSYPTISPLPHPVSRNGAVSFLWHFPYPPLAQTGPRGFPRTSCPAESGLSSIRPSRNQTNSDRTPGHPTTVGSGTGLCQGFGTANERRGADEPPNPQTRLAGRSPFIASRRVRSRSPGWKHPATPGQATRETPPER